MPESGESTSRRPQVTVAADLEAPVTFVFDLLGSAHGMEQWVPFCRAVTYQHVDSRIGLEAGSVRFITLAGGLTATEQIIRCQAPLSVEYTLKSAGISIDRFLSGYLGVTTLVPRSETSCRLQWNVYYECVGICRAFSPLIRSSLSWFVGKMVANICALTGGTRTQ